MFDRHPTTRVCLGFRQSTSSHSHPKGRRICNITLRQIDRSEIWMLLDKEVQILSEMGHGPIFLDAFAKHAARYLTIGFTVLADNRNRIKLEYENRKCAVSLQVFELDMNARRESSLSYVLSRSLKGKDAIIILASANIL